MSDTIEYGDYDKKIQELLLKRNMDIEKAFHSNDPETILKAQAYLQSIQPKRESNMKSFLFSPEHEFYNSLGFKNHPTNISYQVLRNMARTPFIRPIITTRLNQVADFAEFVEDEQKKGWTIRPKKKPFQEPKKNLTDKDKRVIEDVYEFINNGGSEGTKWGNDTFETYLRKTVKDSLEIDQDCTEIVQSRRGMPVEFFAVDGGTMRLAETYDDREETWGNRIKDAVAINGHYPSYVQVYNQQVYNQYYPWELCFGMRNISTNIMNNGYGVSELEDMIQLVTYMLYGMQYNGNFFKQGSNPKGILNLKSGASQNAIQELKQVWRSTIAGVQNCLTGDTVVFTPNGSKALDSYFTDNLDNKKLKVWDGIEFVDAEVSKTQVKKVLEFKLNNGVSIKSSPEHRFLVLGNDGLLWKERRDLTTEDFIVINKNSVTKEQSLKYKDFLVEEDLMEFLGWIIGDGYWGKNENRKRRVLAFYNDKKERDILNKHSLILKKYNINHQCDEVFRSEEQIEYIKEKYSFKSVSKSITSISIFDIDFYDWTLSLGFNPSNEGKVIPSFIYSLDSNLKNSFLRGFFSADGCCVGKRNVQMTISSNKLRDQTRLLLLSEGIRTSLYEGYPSESFGVKRVKDSLLIKDRDLYFEKIGFLQDWKQPKSVKKSCQFNSIPQEFAITLAKAIRIWNNDKKILSKRRRHDLNAIICGIEKPTITRMLSIANDAKYRVPSFLNEYHFEKVVELNDLGYEEEMYDIEVFNEKHAFCANGVITHNSHKIPIIEGQEVEWINMQQTNKEMEFQVWFDFLQLLACSVYTIDPSELGFNFQKAAQMFGQDGQKQRLNHSQSKGLIPVLKFKQRNMNKYIVERLAPGYEFVWCGIEQEDKVIALEQDVKKAQNGFVSMEDMFEKYSNRKFNPEKDTILNQAYNSAQQMKMMGGDYQDGGDEGEDQNPFMQEEDQGNPFQKSENNPFMRDLTTWVDKNIIHKGE